MVLHARLPHSMDSSGMGSHTMNPFVRPPMHASFAPSPLLARGRQLYTCFNILRDLSHQSMSLRIFMHKSPKSRLVESMRIILDIVVWSWASGKVTALAPLI